MAVRAPARSRMARRWKFTVESVGRPAFDQSALRLKGRSQLERIAVRSTWRFAKAIPATAPQSGFLEQENAPELPAGPNAKSALPAATE